MKAKLAIAAALLAFSALPASAQRVISPGMSPDQVRGTFGSPARTRGEGEWSYWFYSNGCPNRCGSDDVVFFRGDRVVAAVLRTRARRIDSAPAADALQQAGGSEGAAAVRLDAAPEGSAGTTRRNEAAPDRVIVRGRSRDRDGRTDNDSAEPVQVGGVTVEPGAQGQVRDVLPPARSGSDLARQNAASAGQSTIIRGAGQGTTGGGTVTGVDASGATVTGARSTDGRTFTGPGVITSGAQPAVPLTDSTQAGRATAVDDARADRESQVTRTTVTTPDTVQARRRDRENSVTPRVLPRP
ncbi:MAG TPA: hypothetical protein VEX86_28365 [Longimicrobium sp.]|nr:hypothetical protein [Longimicrobium sp.]